MTKYGALCAAIRLCEAVRDMEKDRDGIEGAVSELRDVARDVRYGGEWTGDREKLAEVLEECDSGACYMCHLSRKAGCKREIKREAAAAIRSQGKTIKSMEEEIAKLKAEIDAMRGDAYDSDYQAPEPAEWQKEIMERLEDIAPF